MTGILHTAFGIPGILASILTQIGLYSINLGIMGKSNQAINVLQYKLVASLRYVTGEGSAFFFLKLILGAVALIAIIYWFLVQNWDLRFVQPDVIHRWQVRRELILPLTKFWH